MTETTDARELAELRAVVYRVLASALLPPTEDRLSTLVAAAPEIRTLTEPLRPMAFFPDWSDLLDRLGSISDEEAARFREDHTTLFVSGSKGSCPPYESAHLGPDTDVGMVAAGVDSVYRSAGFVVDADGEAPDHAAVELDFLSALCSREADADDRSAAERCRQLEHPFLRAHPLRWFPAFAHAVERARPASVLSLTVGLARRFAEHDAALLETFRVGAR